jgi:glyoxylase-like metal-dependent hydrolase (beta-lactamase superfamily II)
VQRIEIDGHDVVGIRADNPGPFTLTGTNTWIVGRDPAWVIDPGPLLPDHLDRLLAELQSRGGAGGVALTHDHHDHSEAVPELLTRLEREVPVAAARGDVAVTLTDGARFGPLEALAIPGHAPDHLAFLSGGVAFSGDAVLGEGSVFIAPDPGALTGYLKGLAQLRERRPGLILPGHGPVVRDPAAKIDEYVLHRLDRERRLIEAIAGGARSVDQLLDAVWSEVPEVLRPAATVTLAAHLDKLADDGRLPEGVQRPTLRF